MRIGFLTVYNPSDKKAWSGIVHRMAVALNKSCGEVVWLQPPVYPIWLGRFEALILRLHRIFGQKYWPTLNLIRALFFGRYSSRQIRQAELDAVFVLGCERAAFLSVKCPVVYYSDATFQLLIDFYPAFTGLSKLTQWEGNFLEGRTLRRATLALFPGQWAADSAVRDYGCDKSRTGVITWGANLERIPRREELTYDFKDSSCHLIFVAVEWERKGGNVVLEAFLAALEEIPVRLTVCGCRPPSGFEHPNLTVITYLDKNNESHLDDLDTLYRSADIMLMPTEADCYPISIIEANAYGIPVLASAIGGIPGLIVHGETGYLMNAKATGSEYCQRLVSLWKNHETYRAMSQRARDAYEQIFNWDTWGARVGERLRELTDAAAHATPSELSTASNPFIQAVE